MADFTVTINSSDNKVIVNEQTNSLVVISPVANNVTIVSDGIQGPAGTTDHGSLTGLSDDDHTQYHNDSRADTWLATKSTSDLSEGSNLYYTEERVDDRVNALLQAGTNVSLVYNDLANTLTINATGGGGGGASDSFTTIQTDTGTYPVADSATDTLTFTSDDPTSYSFAGDATTDTVELSISDATTTVRGLVSTGTQTLKGRKTLQNISVDEPVFDEGFANEFVVQNTANQTASIRGESASTFNDNNFDLSNLIGRGSYADQGGTGAVGTVAAHVSESILSGNGTVTTGAGTVSLVTNDSSSGTVTNAIAYSGVIQNTSTGTITNGYVLFSDDIQSNIKYGVHIDVAGSKNVFHEIQVKAESPVKFYDADSSNYVEIKSPSTVASNKTATLQDASGTIAYLSDITQVASVFVFSGTNSDISGYESAPALEDYTAGSLASSAVSVTTTPTLLEEFATPAGGLGLTYLQVGLFTIHYEVQKSAGSNNYYTYAEIYSRTSGGTETLLFTSDNSSASAFNTAIQTTVTALNPNIIALNSTDRLVIKVYAVMVSSTATITLRWDDNTDARVQLPSSGIAYTPENIVNKSTDGTLADSSTTLYPSQSAVKTYADTKMAIAGGTFTGTVIPSVVTLTDAATISVNAALGNQFTCTITASRTLGNPTGAINGQLMLFAIRQNGTGGYTLSFDTKYRFGDEIGTPVIATGANKTSYIGVRYHGTDDKFDVISLASNY